MITHNSFSQTPKYSSSNQSAINAFERGLKELDAGDRIKAIPYFEEFIKLYPKNKRVINWYSHTLLNLNSAVKISKKIKNDKHGIIDNFVKAKYYFLTNQIDSSAKYAKCAFQNPNTWKGIIEHTKYYCVYSNWLLKNPEAVKTYKSKLNDYYTPIFELDLNNEIESKYIYNLTSHLAKEEFSKFNNLLKSKPSFKSKDFEAEFNLLQGTYFFEKNELLKSLPFFEKAEQSNDWRKKTIALRYQLDIYLQKTMPIEKSKKLIEKIEVADYNKLTFRISDLIKKYKCLNL